MTAERQPDGEEDDEKEASSGTDTHNSTDSQILLNQLKEITGIQDAAFLHEALKASNNDITRAVGFLTDECAKEPDSREPAAEPSATGGSAADHQVISGVDNLMHDKEALETAIALSLQEATTHPPDGDDASRTHEPQSNESKSRPKRKRCEVWGNPPNPNDLRRVDDWPVGLKNIGNTCWFSAVIQSLFHLPEFRRLVYSYSIPRGVLENCRYRSEKRNIAFMHELQFLFALMIGSNRKFVDPFPALRLLKDAFLSEEAQQQDVSEFTHKLLDWLEDAFQLAVSGDSQRDKSENPMVQLFYGTFLSEGYVEDRTFSNIETFGQYPLQVNGFNNLNQCLEGAMVEGEIENVQTGHSMKYRQERWFTKLPPVLTFELSRFEYNQSLGQPEKIHNKLEFPEIIYMDRYLYKNKELMRKKREESQKLKEHIDYLYQKLERYMKYGTGPHRCPLPDMLHYVLEFASTKAPNRCPPADRTRTSLLETEDSRTSYDRPLENGYAHSDLSSEEGSLVINLEVESTSPSPTSELLSEEKCRSLPEYPAPRTTTASELQSVEACLQRWRTEVEQDIQDLKNSIANISKEIEEIYSDPHLSQVPYRLHAVLVHEGQANAGHYWAYIYSHNRGCWMKYNDISVTESTWEELEKDSYGGMKNASAYCLMYINNKLPYLIADNECGQPEDHVERLPPVLKHYVSEDNQRFEHEVEEWEEAHSCKIPQMEPVAATEPEELSVRCEVSAPSHEEGARTLSSEHAMINKDQTALAITKTAESYERDGVEAALKEPTQPEPDEASDPEASPKGQEAVAEQQPSSRLSEVEIPSVGKILVRSDSDGYNEEVMLCPAMQGVILAILKARPVFDRDGPEAGLVKAFHEEYSRLLQLSKESPSPSSDPRLQHVLVYFFQNKAPERVLERTLLEQFADKNLSYDERSISIMKVARAKLKEIGPNDMDMKEYEKWHEDYSLFRKVSVYLLTGLELYQNGKCQEALTYLVYAHQCNNTLLSSGDSRGVENRLIELYRRKCLLELNEMAARLFESGQEAQVSEGVGIMNDLIIPCMHLIFNNEISEEDLSAIEDMRSRWCSYLGQDIDESLQLKLGQFLPRLLDCSSEIIVLKEPPKIRPHSPYDLCNRFTAVMESIQGASTVTVT
ncbi:ubiquitin carboxyl-terminal hydrolase 28 isoform X2 [Spea bombifrons]|uniref:ubiquitin carboxyl-terminal hydrolase 28 isoform X2 n=1 Tax=Spea bombifrons TaxID=233779 RepID=UPI00234A3E03|nr:ubiquitin carboxyl-terminal hydrolase 28 isoform X2 [Spea bombifrons]